MSFNTYEHWTNAIDKDGTLCISYGKDSLACLRAIELLGWNLKRIVHAEVWATDTISGDLPPMAEFKDKADAIIKDRWGMLKTCKHCGIVDENHICPHRKSRQKSGDRESDKFRKTKRWTDKSIEIRQRDKYLCQICLRNRYNTLTFLNYKTVEVHHITPIAEDYNRRLDNDNLISLCSYHHKMADKGQIPREELYEIVAEIENL